MPIGGMMMSFDQRRHDLAERRADDDANRQVDDVPTCRELRNSLSIA